MRDDKIKELISEGHMQTYEIIKGLFALKMVIYFDNHKPVLISKWKWNEYWDVLDKAEEAY